MKKICTGLLVTVLVMVLAACGSSTKQSLVESQFEALDDLFQRAGTAVAQIDAAVAASDNMVNANFRAYYDRFTAQRDDYAETVEGVKKLDETEQDALLASLEEAVNKAKPQVAQLEELAPELEKLATAATALVSDLNAIIPLVEDSTVSPDLQREYTELAVAYQSLESGLNETLAQAEGAGLDVVLEAVRQANGTLAQQTEKASNLLAGLKA